MITRKDIEINRGRCGKSYNGMLDFNSQSTEMIKHANDLERIILIWASFEQGLTNVKKTTKKKQQQTNPNVMVRPTYYNVPLIMVLPFEK